MKVGIRKIKKLGMELYEVNDMRGTVLATFWTKQQAYTHAIMLGRKK